MTVPDRLCPGVALPPYTYVPGRTPHPVSDPAGHRYGHDLPDGTPVHLLAIDLFNHGYYWEAHEIWETFWHIGGRRGPAADFYKALIQLAVVGVKVREEKREGAVTHARIAAELFAELAHEPDLDDALGMPLEMLREQAEALVREPPESRDPAAAVEVVFAFWLEPAVTT